MALAWLAGMRMFNFRPPVATAKSPTDPGFLSCLPLHGPLGMFALHFIVRQGAVAVKH